MTTNFWIPEGDNTLVATISNETHSFLQQWQNLVHPAILDIDDIQIKELENAFEVKIVSKKLNQFKPSKNIVLSTFEKLFIVKQTITLERYAQQNGLKESSWQMSHLYLHQSGCCGWLPPLQHNKKGLIHFVCELFEFEDVRALEKEGKIPWEWAAFFETDLVDDEFINLFSFIFYQSWLYSTANRLGMKDKVLSKKDYDILYQFGINLGLDDEKIQKLNIIAQQQHPNWKDLMIASN